ncbi:hypothetical protein [Bacillus cereus]|uniref:hypothetical protein n=1 Tax=Bacillus cereus TaxID=1396 RepID=UPI0009C120E5|nr:hypothetical protein [Bacillus cereus]
MRRNNKEEQIQKIVLIQEEIQLLIQYIYHQWEREKQEQNNLFPKLAYTETMRLEHSEAYQKIKNFSVATLREMTAYKRRKLMVQMEECHQYMQSIVSAVIEIIHNYSTS